MNGTRIIALIALFLCIASPLPAATIHVPGDHPTIQAAVDAAADGDTILVADGTWAGAEIEDLEITIRSANGPAGCIVSHDGYGFRIGYGSSVTVTGFTVTGDGYGIYVISSAHIDNCLITYNWRGGIQSHYSGTVITNCEISYNANDNEFGGGGLHAWGVFSVENCLFHHNAAWSDNPGVHGQGGAIWCTFAAGLIINCTFHSNYAAEVGGAIASSQDHAPAAGNGSNATGSDQIYLENCILWGNTAGTASDEVFMWDSNLDIDYSCVEGGASSCSGSINWGEGVIEDDPLFVSGSLGDYFLSQTAAGQAADSPCVDTGNPSAPLIGGTTRTDLEPDADTLDMGWHYPPPPEPLTVFLAAGPGPAIANPPLVRVFPPLDGATHTAQWSAYGADSFGVSVTTGDLDGDGSSEIVTGAGPGAVYGPHVRAFTPGGAAVPGLSFLAYGTHKYGVNVACGDMDGDGRDELVTGAGPGAVFGPHVRGWDYEAGGVSPINGVSFFAYGTPKWGVNVAAGDIDADGYDEIVTGAGPGDIYGPHVRGWDAGGNTVAPIPGVSYLAYGTNKKGVRVTCGDVDGDGIDEIVTAPGPSPVFGSHIRGWDYDGTGLAPIPGIDFFAWEASESLHGATVSALADLDGDGRAEMVVGQGPDPSTGTELRVFSYDLIETALLFSLDAYGDEGLTRGANAAAGLY